MADTALPQQPQPSRRPIRRLFVLLAAVLVVLDQYTKYLVCAHLAVGESWPVLGSLLSFTYSRNTSSAMGLMPLPTRALAVIAALFVVAILIWGVRWAERNGWLLWGLGLLLGGAVGNLLDRVRLNYVVDFIDVHFWPIFNVADIAVCCGAALILIGTLLYQEPACPCRPDAESET